MDVVFMTKTDKMSEDDFKSIGMDIADMLVTTKQFTSKNEARKFIKNGGVKLNDVAVTDPFARVCMNEGKFIVLEHE